jgi:ribosomal silencing factor RsfS
MATVAARAAVSKLADDVVVIDVSGQLVITDCFVIASATNERDTVRPSTTRETACRVNSTPT